jgi:transposase
MRPAHPLEVAMSQSTDAKHQALRESGVLHLRPQDVSDELFRTDEFFDPHDLVQVKYEMLRRVQREGQPVTQVARAFGFSRPSFYQALEAFRQQGLVGLIPKRRGPTKAHKLSEEVLEYIEQQQALEEALRAPELCQRVLQKFGLTVHPRSIERALQRRRKKGR